MSASTETTITSTLPGRVLQSSARDRISSVVFDRLRTPAEYVLLYIRLEEVDSSKVNATCYQDIHAALEKHGHRGSMAGAYGTLRLEGSLISYGTTDYSPMRKT